MEPCTGIVGVMVAARRLDAIRQLADAGNVPVGVRLQLPYVRRDPGLTDHELPAILRLPRMLERGWPGTFRYRRRLPLGVAPLFEDWLLGTFHPPPNFHGRHTEELARLGAESSA